MVSTALGTLVPLYLLFPSSLLQVTHGPSTSPVAAPSQTPISPDHSWPLATECGGVEPHPDGGGVR